MQFCLQAYIYNGPGTIMGEKCATWHCADMHDHVGCLPHGNNGRYRYEYPTGPITIRIMERSQKHKNTNCVDVICVP